MGTIRSNNLGNVSVGGEPNDIPTVFGRAYQAADTLGLTVDVQRDFGASGSDLTGIAATAANRAIITLADAGDWQNGQGIVLYGAGPKATISAPTGFSVTPSTTGTDTWEYAIATFDQYGGLSEASTYSITNGPSSLSNTVTNNLAWTAVTDTAGYAIWRTQAPSGTETGYLGIVWYEETSWKDYNYPVISPPRGVPASPPTSALGQMLFTTISSGAGGITLTLADSATTAGSGLVMAHDDTTAIQAAITSVGNAGGGVVECPQGTYCYHARLVVPSNVTIRGSGIGVSIFRSIDLFQGSLSPYSPHGCFLNSNHVTEASNENIIIEDLEIDGNGSAVIGQAVSPLIWIRPGSATTISCNGIYVRHCSLHDSYSSQSAGAALLSFENVKDAWATDNLGYNSGRDGFDCFGLSDHVHYCGNTIYDTQDDAFAINNIGVIQTTPSVQISHVEVADNIIINGGARGIMLHGVSSGLVRGNIIDNTASWGILLFGGAIMNDVTVEANIIRNASQYFSILNYQAQGTAGGIQVWIPSNALADWPRIKVRANQIYNAAAQGICVACFNTTYTLSMLDVSGNTIDGSAYAGIFLTGTGVAPRNITIIGNQCHANGTRGISVLLAIEEGEISDNICTNNGQTTTHAGIYLGAGTRLTVSGNICCDDQSTPTQKWGITCNGATQTIVHGNVLFGNASGALYLGSNPGSIANNLGYNPVGSINPPASPLVSGTVYQNTSGVVLEIYQPAYASTAGTAGTVAAAMGDTSTPSTVFTQQISGASTSAQPDNVILRVPSNWYYSFTASDATLMDATIIGE